MTWPPSTTRTAGIVTLEPTSPASVSTVRTSSTAAFSCLPPQRTIAYTRELSLCLVRAFLGAGPHRSAPVRSPDQSVTRGSPALAHGWPRGPLPRIHPVGKIIRHQERPMPYSAGGRPGWLLIARRRIGHRGGRWAGGFAVEAACPGRPAAAIGHLAARVGTRCLRVSHRCARLPRSGEQQARHRRDQRLGGRGRQLGVRTLADGLRRLCVGTLADRLGRLGVRTLSDRLGRALFAGGGPAPAASAPGLLRPGAVRPVAVCAGH